MGLVLFSIFSNGIGSRMECILNKSVGDTKLNGAADSLKGRDAIQRDLGRHEECVNKKLIKFSNAKCKVLYIGWCDPRYQYTEE